MKKIIELIIKSFYNINLIYVDRLGTTIEKSIRNFLSMVGTFLFLDIFLYVEGIIGRYFFAGTKTNASMRLITFLTIILFVIATYFVLRKIFSIKFIQSVIEKYADYEMKKSKSIFILVVTCSSIVVMLLLTLIALNVSSNYIPTR